MKQIISTPNAPQPIGAYSQAVKYGPMLYISGQVPIDPETGKVVLGSVKKETRLVMENIKQILAAADMTFENVVQVTVLLRDINDFEKVNKIYSEYFDPQTAPARVAYQVANLPKNANIEIVMIAGE